MCSYGYAVIFKHTDHFTGEEFTEIKKIRLFKTKSERDNAESIEISRRMEKNMYFGDIVKFETKDKYCPTKLRKKS